MDDFKRMRAAGELEFAQRLFCLAIQRFQQIAEDFPKLDFYIGRLIESNHGGEFDLPCSQVVDFLRNGEDEIDKYVEGYLLGWVQETEGRKDK